MNVLITGSTFWNSGDDLVRHGVMHLIRSAVAKEHPHDRVSFALHSFTQPSKNHQSVLSEDLNLVHTGELHVFADWADIIVVPGLATGHELTNFFHVVHKTGNTYKLMFIGGMNENSYCEKHAAQLEHDYGVFSQARLVIGRTDKHPKAMDKCKRRYRCLPCPSIFGVNGTNLKPTGAILFSVQKPHESPHAVVNHSTSPEAAYTCIDVMSTWIDRHGPAWTRIIAHHKSEIEGKPFKQVQIEFHSEEEYLQKVYAECRAVVSTRLHAVLRAEGMGLPALLINSTDRHTHAMKQYPHIPVSFDREFILNWLEHVKDGTITHESAVKWKAFGAYVDAIAEAL